MNENSEFVCLECKSKIESDDNFCFHCGHWTAKGYKVISDQEKLNEIVNGKIFKQSNKTSLLISLLSILIILLTIIIIIRGNNLIRPLAYLKKQINTYKNGYSSSILTTDNVYNKKEIGSLDEAKIFINKDKEDQSYLCSNNIDVKRIEYDLENTYDIPSVSFCDISLNESKKISEVIEKMYKLFPGIKGGLTNITITNAETKDEYIAYFQPMFQFVNVNENINEYNKINKTQILLNSYYFLNTNIMSKPIEEVIKPNWYVKDANWESTIAHELGHYISFKILLKDNNLDNITYVTKENESKILEVLKMFDSQEFSLSILNIALSNYNLKYNSNISIADFTALISNYAGAKDKNGNLIADEAIAEAIHDYYLHKDSCSKASFEIIKVIKAKL